MRKSHEPSRRTPLYSASQGKNTRTPSVGAGTYCQTHGTHQSLASSSTEAHMTTVRRGGRQTSLSNSYPLSPHPLPGRSTERSTITCTHPFIITLPHIRTRTVKTRCANAETTSVTLGGERDCDIHKSQSLRNSIIQHCHTFHILPPSRITNTRTIIPRRRV